ncbi:MAG: signal peptidase II [candidate division NC10 bacterium]
MKLVLWLAGVILVLDQITKAIALRRLALGVPVPVAEGVFSLTLVMNPGLAFGMLSGAPDGWRWIAGVLSLVALAILSVIAALLAGGCPIAARRL